MSRRRVNELVVQLKTKLVKIPVELRQDFLRRSDEDFDSESKDLIETLRKFQLEFDQITSAFDKAKNPQDDQQKETQGLMKNLLTKFKTTTTVVNPEISQKVLEAETGAIAKYLKELEFHKRIADENAALKSYARPATASSTKGSAFRRCPLSAGTKAAYVIQEGNEMDDAHANSDADEISSELNEMKTELMAKLRTHDEALESGRERLQQKLKERRQAAIAAKADTERSRANKIMAKHDQVEQDLDIKKTDAQKKLMSRIEMERKNRVDSALRSNHETTNSATPSSTDLAQFEESIGAF